MKNWTSHTIFKMGEKTLIFCINKNSPTPFYIFDMTNKENPKFFNGNSWIDWDNGVYLDLKTISDELIKISENEKELTENEKKIKEYKLQVQDMLNTLPWFKIIENIWNKIVFYIWDGKWEINIELDSNNLPLYSWKKLNNFLRDSNGNERFTFIDEENNQYYNTRNIKDLEKQIRLRILEVNYTFHSNFALALNQVYL